MTNLISFDWAMKRVLRDKANHAVLEGLMTSLLNEKFTIVRFLESESNQEDENDKFNRVDILTENEKVRKVYSINIVYFTLGQAKDYVYHGKTRVPRFAQPSRHLEALQSTERGVLRRHGLTQEQINRLKN